MKLDRKLTATVLIVCMAILPSLIIAIGTNGNKDQKFEAAHELALHIATLGGVIAAVEEFYRKIRVEKANLSRSLLLALVYGGLIGLIGLSGRLVAFFYFGPSS